MKRILAFITVLSGPLLLTSCGPYGPMRGWEGSGNYWCGFGPGYGGMFMGILFLIVLVVVAYFVIRALKSKNIEAEVSETPLDILKMRYAKGELTKEEFERMKKEIAE